jgi:hypothetical protein
MVRTVTPVPEVAAAAAAAAYAAATTVGVSGSFVADATGETDATLHNNDGWTDTRERVPAARSTETVWWVEAKSSDFARDDEKLVEQLHRYLDAANTWQKRYSLERPPRVVASFSRPINAAEVRWVSHLTCYAPAAPPHTPLPLLP